MFVPIRLYITNKENNLTKYRSFSGNVRIRKDSHNKNNYQNYVLKNLEAISNIKNCKHSIIIDDSNIYDSLSDKQKKCIKGIHYNSKCLSLLTENNIWKKEDKFKSFQTISASCHNNKEISIANKLNLDFIIISPVLKNKGSNVMLGWDGFKKLASCANMPALALGGINDKSKNFLTCLDHGGYGIAGIQSFWKNLN